MQVPQMIVQTTHMPNSLRIVGAISGCLLAMLMLATRAAAINDAAQPPGSVCSAFMLGSDGVWGGDDAFVTASRVFWLRRLTQDSTERRMRERRYQVVLTEEASRELDGLVTRARLANLRNSKRTGIPDEPQATIGIGFCGDRDITVRQFLGDAKPAFLALHNWFQLRIRAAEVLDAAYDGPAQPGWRPEGITLDSHKR
jgi:hypothetical protein